MATILNIVTTTLAVLTYINNSKLNNAELKIKELEYKNLKRKLKK